MTTPLNRSLTTTSTTNSLFALFLHFHKFVFTDFVVNYGSFRLYSQTALKSAQPNAFLAHSKWPVDSLPEILSQIVHKKMGDGLAAAVTDYSLLQG